MIVKLIEIKKKVKKINNFFLLYGGNEGLIEETIKKYSLMIQVKKSINIMKMRF